MAIKYLMDENVTPIYATELRRKEPAFGNGWGNGCNGWDNGFLTSVTSVIKLLPMTEINVVFGCDYWGWWRRLVKTDCSYF